MGKSKGKNYKQYILNFHNRIRNRSHVYYVDTPEEALDIIRKFGYQVNPEELHFYEKSNKLNKLM